MYNWRQMTPVERDGALALRMVRREPWHSVPHHSGWTSVLMFTAACYEHKPNIGYSTARIADFEHRLLQVFRDLGCTVHAYAVLPNHYLCAAAYIA